MFLGLYSPAAEPTVKTFTLLVSCCVFVGISPVPVSFTRVKAAWQKDVYDENVALRSGDGA